MRKKIIITKAGIFAVVIIFLMSPLTGAVNDNIKLELTSENDSTSPKGYNQVNKMGDVVWNNQMDYDTLLRAELDKNTSVDAFPADDFILEKDTTLGKVHWIGGYWSTGYNESHWTWKIAFYKDDGTGQKPGELHAGNFTFEVGNYYETFLEEEPGWSMYYEINVTLPEDVRLKGGEKYWVSIWAVGNEPPYPGWALHYDELILHEAVFKSYYFLNDTIWHNVTDILGKSGDMCYQLYEKDWSDDITPPTVEIIRPIKGLYLLDRYILPRFIRIAQVIGKITIEVNATDNESGINRVEFYYGPLGRKYMGNVTMPPYVLTWKRDRIRFVHFHILKVVAYDNVGNNATDRMFIRKIL